MALLYRSGRLALTCWPPIFPENHSVMVEVIWHLQRSRWCGMEYVDAGGRCLAACRPAGCPTANHLPGFINPGPPSPRIISRLPCQDFECRDRWLTTRQGHLRKNRTWSFARMKSSQRLGRRSVAGIKRRATARARTPGSPVAGPYRDDVATNSFFAVCQRVTPYCVGKVAGLDQRESPALIGRPVTACRHSQ